VSVRTTRHTPTRGYVNANYGTGEIDAVAVYCDKPRECYLLPVSLVEGKSYI
jgi:hypothetical protein